MKTVKPSDLNNQSQNQLPPVDQKESKKRRLLLQKVLRYISIRDRSTQELESYLNRQPEINDTTKAYLFNKLDQFNLINDSQFANQWANAQVKKGKGPIAIKHALIKKGIDPATIAKVISQLKQTQAYDQALLKLAQKKLKTLKGANPFTRLMKLKQYLFSRGYTSSQIQRAIDELSPNT